MKQAIIQYYSVKLRLYIWEIDEILSGSYTCDDFLSLPSVNKLNRQDIVMLFNTVGKGVSKWFKYNDEVVNFDDINELKKVTEEDIDTCFWDCLTAIENFLSDLYLSVCEENHLILLQKIWNYMFYGKSADTKNMVEKLFWFFSEANPLMSRVDCSILYEKMRQEVLSYRELQKSDWGEFLKRSFFVVLDESSFLLSLEPVDCYQIWANKM